MRCFCTAAACVRNFQLTWQPENAASSSSIPLSLACSAALRVTAISCGTWHGMAVTVGGGLLAFGRNHHGQLGTGHTRNMWRPTDISTAFQPGDGSMYYRAAQVACGAMHSLVLVAHRGRQAACSTGGNALSLGHVLA